MKTNYSFEGDGIAPENLPVPAGWRLLVGSIKIQETTSGGIILPDDVKKHMEYGRYVAKVLAIGESCYDHPKFQGSNTIKPLSSWVQVGDYIVVGQYAGQNITCYDDAGKLHTLKILNDDEVLATLPDITIIAAA